MWILRFIAWFTKFCNKIFVFVWFWVLILRNILNKRELKHKSHFETSKIKILEEIMSISVSSSFGLDFWRLFDFSNSFNAQRDKNKQSSPKTQIRVFKTKLSWHGLSFKIFSFSTKFKFIEKKHVFSLRIS